MRVADIPYEADGRNMIGHLAFDDTRAGPRPAVLVSHEGPGLDQHAKDIAEKLAVLGYAAFAPDYNGDGRPLPQDQLMERVGALSADPERVGRLGRAGLDVLMCSGTDDPFATPEQRLGFEAEMREAGVADWRMELYGGVGHSFTHPEADQFGLPGVAYDARADRRSWQSMLQLFDEVLT